MKLVAVLMLTALPLSCFAGCGCVLFEEVIENALNSSVSREDFLKFFGPYLSDEDTAKGLDRIKACYLEQSEETLANNAVVMNYIFNSSWCAPY